MINPFFQNKGPFKIDKILNSIKVENNFENLDLEIFDIKDLVSATRNEITFFHSKKYESVASTTKASYCLTTNKLSNILPKNCNKVQVVDKLPSGYYEIFFTGKRNRINKDMMSHKKIHDIEINNEDELKYFLETL